MNSKVFRAVTRESSTVRRYSKESKPDRGGAVVYGSMLAPIVPFLVVLGPYITKKSTMVSCNAMMHADLLC
jgi:hypothetical protein